MPTRLHTFIITAEARRVLDRDVGYGVTELRIVHEKNFPGFISARPVLMTLFEDGGIFARFEILTEK